MATTAQEIEIYVDRDGKSPYSDWLNSLKDIKARAIIRVRIDRVKLGNFGKSRSVGDGAYELKISYGPGYRVYYGRDGDKLVVLLCGGDKGSQKRDIEKARAYWSEYRS